MRALLPLSTILLLPSILASPRPLIPPRSSIITTTTTAASKPLPLLIWHGLGDNYAADGLQRVGELANQINPDTYVYYIRLDEDAGSDRTATFLGNLTLQIAQVCADIAAHEVLAQAPAVNALGFSQGGQFLRALIQRCGHAVRVNNLVTFGSQHNGIARYQRCQDGDWLCRSYLALLKSNTWSPWVQAHLVPAQYFKATHDATTGAPTDEYLRNSNFLADVNNERPRKNATYAAHLARLQNFVMYVFEDDTTVIPKESGWFAYTNGTDGTVTGLRERDLYKEDWLGLRKLDEKGGLHFKTTPGGHMQLDEDVLTNVFETWFAPVQRRGETVLEGEQKALMEL